MPHTLSQYREYHIALLPAVSGAFTEQHPERRSYNIHDCSVPQAWRGLWWWLLWRPWQGLPTATQVTSSPKPRSTCQGLAAEETFRLWLVGKSYLFGHHSVWREIFETELSPYLTVMPIAIISSRRQPWWSRRTREGTGGLWVACPKPSPEWTPTETAASA